MKVAFAADDAGALPKRERVFAMVVRIAFESHSPGGQRLPRRRANFFCKGEQRAAQTKALPLLLRCRAEANGPCGKRQTGLAFAVPSGDVLLLRCAPWLEAKRTLKRSANVFQRRRRGACSHGLQAA